MKEHQNNFAQYHHGARTIAYELITMCIYHTNTFSLSANAQTFLKSCILIYEHVCTLHKKFLLIIAY